MANGLLGQRDPDWWKRQQGLLQAQDATGWTPDYWPERGTELPPRGPDQPSIYPTPSLLNRIGTYASTIPRRVSDFAQGAFYGGGAGALRVGQGLLPKEQPRMAAMEQWGQEQVPDSPEGRAGGLLGSIAPEFTIAGDIADLARVPDYLKEREWVSGGLAALAAVPVVGTPVAKGIDAMRGADAARAAQEAKRLPNIGAEPGVAGRELKTRNDGTYMGGPIHGPTRVDSPQKLEKMRETYLDNVVEGIEGRDWYTDSSRWIDAASPGGTATAERSANLLAIGSQGRSPLISLGSTSEALAKGAVGDVVTAGPYPSKLGGRYGQAMEGTAPRVGEPWLGEKLDPYRENIQVTRYPDLANRSVHDIWQGRAFGYRHKPDKLNPEGRVWDGGFNPAQHQFMDDEMEVLIKYLNDNKIGGHTDWDHLNTQAAAWTGVQIRAGVLAPEDAAKSYADLTSRYRGYGTSEQIPAVVDTEKYPLAARHIAMEDLSPAERQAYSAGKMEQHIPPDAQGRDPLHEAAGLMQDPTISSTGSFRPEEGGLLEFNPLAVHRPMVMSRDGKLIEQSERVLDTVEGARAYADVQNAGSWHFLIPDNQSKSYQRTSLHIPLDRPATESELRAIHDIADREGWFVSDTGLGVNLIEDPSITPAWASELTAKSSLTKAEKEQLKKWGISGEELGRRLRGDLGVEVLDIFPGADLRKIKAQSGYIGYDLTEAGSGRATQSFLDLMDETPEVARAIEARLMERMEINRTADAAESLRSGRPQNPDVERAREIFIAAVKAGESGYEALRKALADPNIALPSVAILGALGLRSQTSEQGGLLGSPPM